MNDIATPQQEIHEENIGEIKETKIVNPLEQIKQGIKGINGRQLGEKSKNLKDTLLKKKALIFKIFIGVISVIFLIGIGVVLYNALKKEEIVETPPKEIIPPEKVTEDFYLWYLNYIGDPMKTQVYKTSDILEENLIKKIEEDYNITQIDPIFCAKTKPESIKIISIDTKENTSKIVIEEEFKYIEKYEVDLSFANEKWKITDIVCPKIDDIKQGIKESKIVINIYFNKALDSQCGKVYAVERIILRSEDPLVRALNLLFAGPVDEEKKEGFSSVFSEKTKDTLNEVTIENDIAYVNLKDIRGVISDITVGCNSENFKKQIEETIKEYSSVKEIRYLINGSEEDFNNWIKLD